MCNECKVILSEKKTVIKQAAFKHVNDFVEANDLIQVIRLKFLRWKKKQTTPIKVNNSFFHTIAHNAALDEIRPYDLSIDDPQHQRIIDNLKFNDPSAFILAQRIMKDLSVEEKDAIMSIINREHPDEYAERYEITYVNAIKRRRRILEKVKKRVLKDLEENNG